MPPKKGFRSGVRNTLKATLADGRLNESHVNLIDVRPLFAIDFDTDEMSIKKVRDGIVFKRFAFHHVTPMAGRVTDAQEDGSIFAARFRKGVLSPSVPIHRIELMLEQVG